MIIKDYKCDIFRTNLLPLFYDNLGKWVWKIYSDIWYLFSYKHFI